MSEPQNPDTASSPALEQIVEQAAFLGSFDPRSLLSNDGSALYAELLGGLAERCVEVPVEDTFQWSLTPNARAQTFARLSRGQRLHAVAQSARHHPFLDQLGGMLVDLVIDGAPSPADIEPPELDMLRVASSLLGDALPSLPTQAINGELERRSIDQGLSQLRSGGLIGRDVQLDDILNWLKAPTDSFRMMGLSGIGGAGKSALLAELVSRVRGPDWRGQPVIWLDFDHPARIRLDQAGLMSELLRQVALHPGFDSALAQQGRAYLDNARVESGDYRTLEGLGSAQIGHISMWHDLLDKSRVRGLQLLVICDTFEEVLYRGEDERELLLQLLRRLGRPNETDSVRVICSGRELPGLPDWEPDHALALKDLPPEPAAELFWRTAGIPENAQWPVAALIEKFGGNPLVVKLLARQTAGNGAVLHRLLKDKVPAGADSEFVQGFLYTRILNRIRTDRPAVRKLALPGLALRRVSPILIRDVLAAPCGLGKLDNQECADLFHELARQFWLVQATPDAQVVLHRRDLRRLMLLGMESRYADAIREIHRGAVSFYEQARDPALSLDEQQLEADYHRLLLGELLTLETDYAHELLQTLGPDLACVPVSARATLKLHAGRTLSNDEVQALAGQDLDLHQASVRERQSATGNTLDSFESPQDGAGVLVSAEAPADTDAAIPAAETLPDAPSRQRRIDPAEIHQAFALREFSWLAQVAIRVASLTFERGSSLGLSREGRTLTESPLWQVCIASLIQGQRGELVEMFAKQLGTKQRLRGESWNRYGSESITFAQGIAAALRLLDPAGQLPTGHVDLNEHVGRRITTHEQLRVWQLLGDAFGHRKQQVGLNVLNYMDLSFSLNRSPSLGFDFDAQAWSQRLRSEAERSDGPPRIASLRQLAAAARPVRIGADSAVAGGHITLLRGPALELYPILRSAVTELPPDRLMGLCRGMEERFPNLWPRELRWDVLSHELGRAREQWIATLVEQSDRFDDLVLLLHYTGLSARAQDPDIFKIWLVLSETINQALAARLRSTD